MGERATSYPRMRRGAAVLVCATISLSLAGCFETVSLGEGSGDGEGGRAEPAPVHTAVIPVNGPGDLPQVDPCHPGFTTDLDGDGYTPAEGDCNDCDPDVGPDAAEMPTAPGETPLDENCNGVLDEEPPVCDGALSPDDPSPLSAARALDLCRLAEGGKWGVVTAAWVLPDGSLPPKTPAYDLGHGILDGFGPNVAVRRGARLLALSTGTARQPKDPGYQDPKGFEKGYSSLPPDGFPKGATSCAGVESGAPQDSIALDLSLRAPQNADALAFDFDFYSYELPARVCSRYSDLFVALQSPAPKAHVDGNIALDLFGGVISVNTAAFDVCACSSGPPCVASGRELSCSLGKDELLGTGFGADLSHDGDHAATGWLTTESEVQPGGTVRLRLAIQDAEDGRNDSTVLLDHFRWVHRSSQPARKHFPLP